VTVTALAVRDDQTYWDDTQLAVLYQTGISPDVTRPELTAFLHECQRRRLDPFIRQIYLIGRWDSRAGRVVFRPQTSIDGFRVIARRAATASGADYGYESTVWYDGDGIRHLAWLSDTPPAAAKVVVIRNGNRFDGVARFGAYVQTGKDGRPVGQWQSMGDVMIAKCAEALALRKAFPEDLSGLFTDDEMGQDGPQAAAPPARQEPAGVITRPKQETPAGQPEQEEEADPDAQAYADEAHAAHTAAELAAIAGRARDAGKQGGLIRAPGSGKTGKLSAYLAYRRRVLEDADKAVTSLMEAAQAAGVAVGDLDERMRGITGTGVEDATPAQLREAAAVLLKAVTP
jgi:phage recombination protein Bet